MCNNPQSVVKTAHVVQLESTYSRGKKDTFPYNISPMEMRSLQQSITCIKDPASPLN